MARKAFASVATKQSADHPAIRAWSNLGGDPPEVVEWWQTERRSKPALYRLVFETPGRPAVFAKHSHHRHLVVESRLYEDILPRLAPVTPRCRGICQDEDGSSWLFVEEVEGEVMRLDDPQHRVLAGRWLGSLQRSAADLPAAARLPDAGPARYLIHLRAAREAIRTHYGNPTLSAEQRAVLDGMLAQLDELEGRWPALERACEGMPVTLVHGDFQPKNVRILVVDGKWTACPIDWETAGWGVPAADLAPFCGRGLEMQIDPGAYEATVRGRWEHLDAAKIRRLSILGCIFRGLAATEWSSVELRYEGPRDLIRPVIQIRLYQTQMCAALQAAEWLG